MHTVLGAAEAASEPLVGVVATPPEWFTQFGFAPGANPLDHTLGERLETLSVVFSEWAPGSVGST